MDARIKSGHDECFCVDVFQIRVSDPAARCARAVHESFAQQRAWGCRVPDAPAASCAKCSEAHECRRHGRAGSPGIPARNGFNGLLRALPGDRLFATVASGYSLPARSGRLASANLTPAPGRQDHTTSPSAKSIVRQHALDRSHAGSPPCHHVARPTLPRPPHPIPRP